MKQETKNKIKFSLIYGSIFYGIPTGLIFTGLFNLLNEKSTFNNWYIFLPIFLVLGFFYGMYRFNRIFKIASKEIELEEEGNE